MNTWISGWVLIPALISGFAAVGQVVPPKYAVEMPVVVVPVSTVTWDVAPDNRIPKLDEMVSVGGAFSFFPNRALPVGIELRGSTGRYAFGKETRTYSFPDAEDSELDVEYTSRMHKVLLGLKLVNVESTQRIKPFASVHAGYALMRSRIFIPDPLDVDQCAPIENRVVHWFNGLVYGAEAGLEVNLLRNRSVHGEGMFVFVSGSVLKSFRDVEYINVDYLMDEMPVPATGHGSHQQAQSSNARNAVDFNAQFINVSSNEVH